MSNEIKSIKIISHDIIKEGGDFSYRYLRCVIKMTECTPISGVIYQN